MHFFFYFCYCLILSLHTLSYRSSSAELAVFMWIPAQDSKITRITAVCHLAHTKELLYKQCPLFFSCMLLEPTFQIPIIIISMNNVVTKPDPCVTYSTYKSVFAHVLSKPIFFFFFRFKQSNIGSILIIFLRQSVSPA